LPACFTLTSGIDVTPDATDTFFEGIVMTEATQSSSSEVSGLFEQAYRTFGDSLKVALKAQEEGVKYWAELVSKVNPAQAVAVDWIPVAQKNTDEYLRLMETSYRRNAEVLKKAIRTPAGDSASMEQKAREWWDASVQAINENVMEVTATQMRVAQSWSDLLKKSGPVGAPAGK
jgi:hypothetical protein